MNKAMEETEHANNEPVEKSEEKLNVHTRDFEIKGRAGKWSVRECVEVEGRLFYLMENQKFRDRLEYVILSEEEEIAVEKSAYGFDKTALEQIHAYIAKQKEKDEYEKTGKRISVRKRLQEKKSFLKEKQNGFV